MGRTRLVCIWLAGISLWSTGCTREVSQAEQKAADIVTGRKADNAAKRGICIAYQESGSVTVTREVTQYRNEGTSAMRAIRGHKGRRGRYGDAGRRAITGKKYRYGQSAMRAIRGHGGSNVTGGKKHFQTFSRSKALSGAISVEKKWVDEQATWARKEYSAEASNAFVRILDDYLAEVSKSELHSLCSTSVREQKRRPTAEEEQAAPGEEG